jgi:hypothetical protein
MKTTITLISLSAILACLTLVAQESPRPAAGGGNIETIFRQLDRNGDGKLDAAEAGDRPFFKPADKNGDGVLTLDEVKAYFGSRSSGKSPAAPKLQPTEKP